MLRKAVWLVGCVAVMTGAAACTSSEKKPEPTTPASTTTTPAPAESTPPATAEGEPRMVSASAGLADTNLVLSVTFDGPVACGEAAASHVELEVAGGDATPGDFGSCADNTMTVIFRGLASPEGGATAHYTPATPPTDGNAVYRDTSSGRVFAVEQNIAVD